MYKSEFEENDEDLAHYLQANTSFLVSLHATAAFTEAPQNESESGVVLGNNHCVAAA